MSVHSNHYDDYEEYKRDLQTEYRHEAQDDLYTDDADDPHWRCENCNHCKEYQIYKRVIESHPRYYYKDKNSTVRQEDNSCFTLWVGRDYKIREMQSVWLCEIDHKEHMDDDYCGNFEEKEG